MVRPCRAERAVPRPPGKVFYIEDLPGAGQEVPEPGPQPPRGVPCLQGDPLPFRQAQAQTLPGSPTDIDTIEYFASPDDICRAFAGLQQLAAQPKLAPLGPILSAGGAGIGLDPAQWPTVWFKGGSEPGVLTLGYLATNSKGRDLRGRRAAQRPGSGTVPVGPGEIVGNCPGRLRAGPVTPARAPPRSRPGTRPSRRDAASGELRLAPDIPGRGSPTHVAGDESPACARRWRASLTAVEPAWLVMAVIWPSERAARNRVIPLFLQFVGMAFEVR